MLLFCCLFVVVFWVCLFLGVKQVVVVVVVIQMAMTIMGLYVL